MAEQAETKNSKEAADLKEAPQGKEGARDTNSGPENNSAKTTDTKEGTDASSAQEAVILEGIEKREDGKFEFVVDPEDEDSTVYVGESPDDILKQIRKGIREKDRVIRRAKVNDRLQVSRRFSQGRSEEDEGAEVVPVARKNAPELTMPDPGQIFKSVLERKLAETGIAVEKLRWTDADWDKYAEEHDLKPAQVVREQMRADQLKKEANAETDSILSSQRVIVENNRTLKEETDEVAGLLEEAGIDLEGFDFEAILKKCYSEYVDNDGRLKPGKITIESQREINRILKTKSTKKSALKADIEDRTKKSKEKEKQIPSPSGMGGDFKLPKTTAANYDAAERAAREEVLGTK